MNSAARLAQFHEDPQVIRRLVGWAGPLLRALTPGRRRTLLALGAVWVAVAHPLADVRRIRDWMDGAPGSFGAGIVVALSFAFLALTWYAARRYSAWPAWCRRHPQICLHSLFWSLLAVAWATEATAAPWRAVLAGLIAALPFLLWRVGYMLMSAQNKKLSGSFLRDHLFYLWPAFGGSSTPHGKGPIYLLACEARNEEELARSQLAGIKLLLLAGIWAIVKEFLDGIVFHEQNGIARAVGWTLGLPRLHELLDGSAAASIAASWSVLYLELIQEVLRMAIKGHVVIGILRLFGFNVFRNTYKPLLAETIVEFWNRYYYYFKELLVHFFFPVFSRYFKKSPTLRMLTAVAAAAFLGNMYYHLIDEWQLLFRHDAQKLWVELGSRLVYCALLTAGIFLSMRREQSRGGRAPTRSARQRWSSRFTVWTFFAIIHLWSAHAAATPLPRFQFFLGLLGWS